MGGPEQGRSRELARDGRGWDGVQSRWVANEDGERGQWTLIKEDVRENQYCAQS